VDYRISVETSKFLETHDTIERGYQIGQQLAGRKALGKGNAEDRAMRHRLTNTTKLLL
jgi:hypothetical protein